VSYLPLYFQVVLGATPILSGVYLFAMVVTFSIGSAFTGFFIKKTGIFKPLIVAGFVLLTLGYGLFIDLPDHAVWSKIIIYQIIVGIGVAPNFQAPLVALQSRLKGHDVAVGTATFGFIRNLATAISIVVGGVVFQQELKSRKSQLIDGLGRQLGEQFASSSFGSTADQLKQLSTQQKDVLDRVYTDSLKRVWIFYTAFAGFGILVTFFIKSKELSREKVEVKTGLAEQERVRIEEKEEERLRKEAKHSRGPSKNEQDLEKAPGSLSSPTSPTSPVAGTSAGTKDETRV
jgi:hypothetical protein